MIMSFIGNIRKHPKLLLGIFGISLTTFITQEIVFYWLNKRQDSDNKVLVNIKDQKIYTKDYEYRLDSWKQYIQSTFKMKAENWLLNLYTQNLLNEMIQEKEYELLIDELKIAVGKEELIDMFKGNHIHENVKRSFTNEKTKEFDKNKLSEVVNDLIKSGDQGIKRLENYENYIADNRKKTKLDNIIKNLSSVTKYNIDDKWNIENTTLDIDYLYIPYSSIKNEEIEFNDQDLENYVKSNKEKYFTEAYRKIRYFIIPINFSQSDIDICEQTVNSIYKEFSETTDAINYARLNNDNTENIEQSLSKDELPEFIKDLNENEVYYDKKILDKYKAKINKDNKISVSSEKNNDEHDHKHDDEKCEHDHKHDDEKLDKIIKISFYKYIDKTDDQEDKKIKYNFLVIDKEFKISEETKNNLHNEIYKDISKIKDINNFESYANEHKYDIQKENVKISTKNLSNINNSRDFVHHVFKTKKVNTLISPILTEKGYVISYFEKDVKEGITPFEDIKDDAKKDYIQDKKIERIKNKLKEMSINDKSISDIAKMYNTMQTGNIKDLKYSDTKINGINITNLESLYYIDDNVNKILVDTDGIFVIRVNNRQVKNIEDHKDDYNKLHDRIIEDNSKIFVNIFNKSLDEYMNVINNYNLYY